MDRFSWSNGLLEINETLVIQQRGVRLYDGDDKVQLYIALAVMYCYQNIATKFFKNFGKLDCSESQSTSSYACLKLV